MGWFRLFHTFLLFLGTSVYPIFCFTFTNTFFSLKTSVLQTNAIDLQTKLNMPHTVTRISANTNEQEGGLSTLAEGSLDTTYEYDWKEHWYPLGVANEMVGGTKAPIPVSIFDHEMVLFKDAKGEWQCVKDFCPHRAAKLSQGQVTEDGNIECLYHGWKFDGSGACTLIPQLEEDSQIPKTACIKNYPVEVREGIIYVYMGTKKGEERLPVPVSEDDLDSNPNAMILSDFQVDLPYDHTYLLENLLDPAHIHISHDATQGGGSKKNARALTFDIIERNAKGIKCVLAGFGPKPSRYDFEAPCNIRSRSLPTGEENQFVFGTHFGCVPFGKGRSRLVFRVYAVNPPGILKVMSKLRPKFLQYLNSCKILDQDMGLIASQEDYVARTGESLKEAFLPIKSSDGLVLEYRKWLDAVGNGLPFYAGWQTSKLPTNLTPHENILDHRHRTTSSRFDRHVSIQKTTYVALHRLRALRKCASIVAGVALVLAAGPRVLPMTTSVISVVSGLIAIGSKKLESHFFKSFERHPVKV